MDFVSSFLIMIIFLLLYAIFAAWLDKFGRQHKEEFIEKTINKVSTHLTTSCDLYKTGPWYLVVYTQEADHPI